jgi:hypothetical protein
MKGGDQWRKGPYKILQLTGLLSPMFPRGAVY